LILADTDVLIDYLAGAQPIMNRVTSYAAAGRLQTSAISCLTRNPKRFERIVDLELLDI
jgi:predicted nucleic acid-binding protein